MHHLKLACYADFYAVLHSNLMLSFVFCLFKLEEDRALEIQFHNNILLEKILRIKRTKGGIDSWNDYEPKRFDWLFLVKIGGRDVESQFTSVYFLYRTTESYQSYQPLFPTKNKYLQQKWDKATYDLHRRKVSSNTGFPLQCLEHIVCLFLIRICVSGEMCVIAVVHLKLNPCVIAVIS